MNQTNNTVELMSYEGKSIGEIISYIQSNIKVPKDQRNEFGNFKYRNAEDILSGLKIFLKEGLYLNMSDDIILIGDRYYVKAIVTLHYKDQSISTVAMAREMLNKKKCDEPQVTGGASSYARKYALCGLLAIDDSKLEQVADIDSGVDRNNNGRNYGNNNNNNSNRNLHRNNSKPKIDSRVTQEMTRLLLTYTSHNKDKEAVKEIMDLFKLKSSHSLRDLYNRNEYGQKEVISILTEKLTGERPRLRQAQ